ncbi:MAG: hypothetical protein RI960_951, partial [Pseudomonadota bacterium]
MVVESVLRVNCAQEGMKNLWLNQTPNSLSSVTFLKPNKKGGCSSAFLLIHYRNQITVSRASRIGMVAYLTELASFL